MNIALGKKGNTKNRQLEILQQHVSKGFAQLAAGEISANSVMDIFDKATKKTNTRI